MSDETNFETAKKLLEAGQHTQVITLWSFYERPIGSEQQHDVLAAADYPSTYPAWRCLVQPQVRNANLPASQSV